MPSCYGRHKKRRIVTVTAATAATNDSSSESDDEMLFIPNDKDSVDITRDLIELEFTDDDTNADYEPGGDDKLLITCYYLSKILYKLVNKVCQDIFVCERNSTCFHLFRII